MTGTKLLKVAFGNIAYWKNEEVGMGRPMVGPQRVLALGGLEVRLRAVGMGRPTVGPQRGLKKDDIVTWTGRRSADLGQNMLQVLHPHQGLIWVQETYLDSF